MITKIFKTALILTLSVSLFSCKKDKDEKPSYNEENFLEAYLTSTGFKEASEDFINSGSFEYGLEFTPTVKGKITSLSFKIPDANPALRVTIWDKAAGTIFRTEIVNVATANVAYSFDISDLELTKDKSYAITINSGDWYYRTKTDESAATYPITAGNIRIDNYIWVGGSTQAYPKNIADFYFAGDFSFNFLQMD